MHRAGVLGGRKRLGRIFGMATVVGATDLATVMIMMIHIHSF
jgi:hypothetical protein